MTGGGRHVRCDCDAGSESWIFGTENSRVGARRNREGGRGAVRVAPPCEQPAREVSAAGAPPRRQLGYFTGLPPLRRGPGLCQTVTQSALVCGVSKLLDFNSGDPVLLFCDTLFCILWLGLAYL